MDDQQLVVFRLIGEEYAVPIHQVLEILRYKKAVKVPNAPKYVDGIINLRGKSISVINLETRFGMQGSVGEDKSIIILDLFAERLGIVVDQVTEVMRLEETEIKEAPSMVTQGSDFITGVCQLGDRIIMVLDLSKLLDQGEIKALKGSSDNSLVI